VGAAASPFSGLLKLMVGDFATLSAKLRSFDPDKFVSVVFASTWLKVNVFNKG
jgi:hypothetical protein